MDITLGAVTFQAVNLLTTLATMAVIFLGEEIGWRGYMLPRVQQLTGRRRAALATGFAHGCFHLPLILIATTYDPFGHRWIVAPMVVATLTVGGVFYAYLWDRTHSVWPVSLAHGAVNTAFGLGAAAVVAGSQTDLAYVADESGVATFLAVAVVGGVLLARAPVWRNRRAVAATVRTVRCRSADPVRVIVRSTSRRPGAGRRPRGAAARLRAPSRVAYLTRSRSPVLGLSAPC